MQTGQIIRELRLRAGLSQDELADKLFVSRFLVSKWENDVRRPGREYIEQIAGLFSVKPGDITDISLIEELSEFLPAERNISEESLKQKVNSFLESLNERERNIFIMRYYYMTDIPELCSAYGMKSNAVYTSLSRTKAKLKEMLRSDTFEK